MYKFTAFLSYAKKDDEDSERFISKLAKQIEEAVSRRNKDVVLTVFIDRDIAAGSEWKKELNRSSAKSDFLISILTPSYFNSDWCLEELKGFLSSDIDNQKRRERVYPIYLIRSPNFDQAASDAENVVNTLLNGWRAETRKAMLQFYKQVQYIDLLRWKLHDLEMDETKSIIIGLADNIVRASLQMRGQKISFPLQQKFDNTTDETFKNDGLYIESEPVTLVIESGRFTMGATSFDSLADNNEKPAHEIHINNKFKFGAFPITFEEFDRYCIDSGATAPDDAGWGRGLLPVINVSWNDAQSFCIWLSRKLGKNYRLPSEAEWEYVAKTGRDENINPLSISKKNQINIDNRYGKTIDVKHSKGNTWGVYDMIGNVREWCGDTWHENYINCPSSGETWENGNKKEWKVIRSASWSDPPNRARITSRSRARATDRSRFIGFRVVCDFDED